MGATLGNLGQSYKYLRSSKPCWGHFSELIHDALFNDLLNILVLFRVDFSVDFRSHLDNLGASDHLEAPWNDLRAILDRFQNDFGFHFAAMLGSMFDAFSETGKIVTRSLHNQSFWPPEGCLWGHFWTHV